MNVKVLWWALRDEFKARWRALVVSILAVLLGALGWTEVTIHGESSVDMALLAGTTAAATGIALLISLLAALGVMWRYSYQVAHFRAEKGFATLVRVMLAIGFVAITLGLIVHGGRFLHVEIILKLVGIGKGE